MNPDFSYPKHESELKSAILGALSHCYGIDNAMSGENLLELVFSATGQRKIDNRQLRDAIMELRGEGYLICSTSGKGNKSGYYRPVTLEEYKRYRNFHVSYAKNIFSTVRAMDRSAEQEFPYDLQPGLFDDLTELEVR